jgi:hypothetical protein
MTVVLLKKHNTFDHRTKEGLYARNKEQLAFIEETVTYSMQGFYLSKPVYSADFEQLLKSAGIDEL